MSTLTEGELHPKFWKLDYRTSHGLGEAPWEVRQKPGEVRTDLQSVNALLASDGAIDVAVGQQDDPWSHTEAFMRAFLRAMADAISAALTGVWKVIDGVWTFVRTAARGGSPDVGAIPDGETNCHMSYVSETDVATSIKQWARDQSPGQRPRLPTGITPAAAGWATRLRGAELDTVAKSSPAMIAAHLDGSAVLAGVRPTVVAVDEEAEKKERLATLRARGASLRAAVDRSLAASGKRAAAPGM